MKHPLDVVWVGAWNSLQTSRWFSWICPSFVAVYSTTIIWPSHPNNDTFRCVVVIKHICVLIQTLLKYIPHCSIHNKPSLVQVMACCGIANKPLPLPMMNPFAKTLALIHVSEYSGQTSFISYLQMPWLLPWPGHKRPWYIDGLVQDYSNSSALAMGLLQSCTNPTIWFQLHVSSQCWGRIDDTNIFLCFLK